MEDKIASAAPLAIGGLRVAWGLGASWPRIDRDRADPAARITVVGMLGVGAGLVAGGPRRAPRLTAGDERGVTAGRIAARRREVLEELCVGQPAGVG